MLLPEVMRMKKNKKSPAQKQSFYGVVAVLGILALGTFVTIDQMHTNRMQDQMKKVELADSKHVSEEHNNPLSTESEEQEFFETTTEQIKESTNKPLEQTNVVGDSAIKTEKKEVKKTEDNISYDGTTKLKWPISGNVILPFSMDSTIYFQTLDQYQCNPGMMIQASEGADIKSIAKGKVINVEKTSKYGTTVTVDVGNHFCIKYGQLKDVTCKKGDVLEVDALIGRVAKVTEFFTLEGNHLYFEMNKNDKPVNPMKYLE